jgi:hypothetical protein
MTRRCAPFLLLLGLTACPDCDEVIVDRATKRIAVDVCTEEPNINGKGGVNGCNVDFGQANLSERVTREVTLSNVSDQDLKVESYQFTSSSDPSFSVDHLPTSLRAGVSARMVLSFRPMLESEVVADIILVTDAENADNPGPGKVTIHVRGTGANNGLPQLRVEVLDQASDACCDLGLVAMGSIASCRVRLTNTGTRGLVLDEVRLLEGETTGSWTPVGSLPTDPLNHGDDANYTIPPNESSTISFRFTPTDLLPHQARVQIVTNDPSACGPVGAFDSAGVCSRRSYLSPCPQGQHGVVTVDMRGQGADPPVCVARIKSVNGSSSFDPRLIEPLDDVQLTAEDSTSSVPGITITGFKWTITRRPPGSNVRFDNDSSPTPRFAFDNTSTVVITGLDVAGEYEARCEATDSRGTRSVNDAAATVGFMATPSEAIHVQLVWDAPSTDVDLHLIRQYPDGQYQFNSDTEDCYYANCKPTMTNSPNWDPANALHQGGNPVLDVDDVEGYGPENININAPVPNKYKTSVCYYSDHGNGDTVATLRVYLYGNLIAEYMQLIRNGDLWDVGNVAWQETGAPVWEEVNTVDHTGITGCDSYGGGW